MFIAIFQKLKKKHPIWMSGSSQVDEMYNVKIVTNSVLLLFKWFFTLQFVEEAILKFCS